MCKPCFAFNTIPFFFFVISSLPCLCACLRFVRSTYISLFHRLSLPLVRAPSASSNLPYLCHFRLESDSVICILQPAFHYCVKEF
ncbi:hypothetical protein Sjap_020802 [Stephania japonica]|uniref:Uncharacterized protein n=1 Tax=Stephania japonica TaxID=461633 RepID=A0AAP0F6P3_9MAGN